ncbi:MAG TPA: geranylgeranylglycerol-phosphate geranylgeranyltransferase [Chitinophagaceae bacterium]|nr:geranylgeranylglycerol-phosphate geranylgeranyltransferase [Chitinophagaceae bacterium]
MPYRLHIRKFLKLVRSFLRLVRYPNLIFIFLTQYLLQYGVIRPVLGWYGIGPTLSGTLFFLLCLSTVLVAAAGYIINDYFDINIDLVNRPGRIIVDKVISRRWAIAWHTLLNTAAVILGFLVAFSEHNWMAGFIQPICTGLLWFYSTSYKRQLITGNLVISLLTAMTVLVVGIYEPMLYRHGFNQPLYVAYRLDRILAIYALFAFLISLVREIVKDLEDLPGDLKEGCRTIPIAWGINQAKGICYALTALLVLLVFLVQFRLGAWGWWGEVAYLALLVQLPLVYTTIQLKKATLPAHFHRGSTLLKGIMLTGILSMLFFA